MKGLTLDRLQNAYTVFDVETRDDFIDKKMGAGWVFSINYPDIGGFKVLGTGVYDKAFDKLYYQTDKPLKITPSDVLVAHNLTYDVGTFISQRAEGSKDTAISLLREMYRSGVILIDTIILAKLVDEHRMQYSLEALAKIYKVKQKDTKILADEMWNSGLYAKLKDTVDRKVRNRPSKDSVLLKLAYKNLDLLNPKIVKEYCLTDVTATNELYMKLMDKLCSMYDTDTLLRFIQTYSTLQFAILEMRIQGISIDMNSLRHSHLELCKMLQEAKNELSGLSGGLEVNVAASASLVQALFAWGYDEEKIPKTAKGNYSCTQAWLEEQNNEITQSILEVRRLNKIIGTFIDGMRTMQDEIQLGTADVGKVHGEFKIHGAKTGRFSSANPNLQQIPKRNPRFNKVCRGMFIAGKGRKFVAADYSSQETRISAHFGYLLGVSGATEIKLAYDANPKLDFHQKVAELCDLTRKNAKAINLGLSYSMGEAKLCNSLGLPTYMGVVKWSKDKVELAGPEGKAIIDKYHTMLPFLKQLTQVSREVQKKRGYLRSISGRSLHSEVYLENGRRKKSNFKALNQLIQGSAADFTIKAMVDMYDYICYNEDVGIKMLGCIHDELIFTIDENKINESEQAIKEIMETAVTLEVPMIVDISIGDSWYEE